LTNKIQFKSILKGLIPDPKPAKFFIPEAYKKMTSRIDDTFSNGTIKSCIPFLDAYTTGYIIPFPTDIRYHYDKEKNTSEFAINSNIPTDFIDKECVGVNSHNEKQISSDLRSSKRTIDSVFKFMNPWTISTPKGYSCLFINPFNRNLPFDLITGIVDTDDYKFQVHFPFYWTKNAHESYTLEQGSPMALVIPFKRESWEIRVNIDRTDQETNDKKALGFFSTFIDNYKTKIWKKKSFK
jgi:hypothetical protein